MNGDLENALRTLPGAPHHGPQFMVRLWASIDDVDAEADDLTRAGGEVVIGGGRRRRSRWFLALSAAAVVAVVAFIVISTHHVVGEYGQPPAASAAEVVANMRRSLVTFRTVSATVIKVRANVEGPEVFKRGWTSADWFARARVVGPATSHSDPQHMIATADGCLRVVTHLGEDVQLSRDVPAEGVQTQDDRNGLMSWYAPETSSEGSDGSKSWSAEQAILITGRPLGPPDLEGQGSSWMSTTGLQSSAFSILSQGTVEKATYERRPALVVSAAVTPGPVVAGKNRHPLMSYGQFDRITVTVDEATWFPMRYTTFLHGDVLDDIRLTNVRLDDPVDDAAFAPGFPEGVKVEKDDEGFRRLGLEEAAHAYSYVPFAPTRLPESFGFSGSAVADKSEFFVMRGIANAEHEYWLPTWDVTALQYRAGFLSFTVTTRPERGMHDPLLADPFARDPAQIAACRKTRTVTISRGALRGVKAKIATPALGVPHLWAFHEGLMVTIGGDLTRKQLLEVAESLQPLE